MDLFNKVISIGYGKPILQYLYLHEAKELKLISPAFAEAVVFQENKNNLIRLFNYDEKSLTWFGKKTRIYKNCHSINIIYNRRIKEYLIEIEYDYKYDYGYKSKHYIIKSSILQNYINAINFLAHENKLNKSLIINNIICIGFNLVEENNINESIIKNIIHLRFNKN